MIQNRTVVFFSDNSGVQEGTCIQVRKHKYGFPGDTFIFSIRKVRSSSKFLKGQLCEGLIIRSVKSLVQFDGGFSNTGKTEAVLISKQGIPLAKRVFGPVNYSLKKKGFFRVLFLAKEII